MATTAEGAHEITDAPTPDAALLQRLEAMEARRHEVDRWEPAYLQSYLSLLVLTGQYRAAREFAERQHLANDREPNRACEFARFLVHEDEAAGLKWYSDFVRTKSRTIPGYFGLASLLAETVGNPAGAMSVIREIAGEVTRLPALLNLYVLHSMYRRDLDPLEHLNVLQRMVRQQFGAALPPSGSVSKRPRYMIGFVCSALYRHAISMFVGPLLTFLDRKKFMIIVFSSTEKRDPLTEEFEKAADVWYDVSKMSDPELLELVRSERVDVLIDLDNHTPGNRLWVFAQRAAPIQMAFYGFNTTTGLDAMDYRLTDAIVDPPGFEHHYSEKLLRTRDCHISYFPTRLSPSPAPQSVNGYPTFGSFNDWKKIDAAQVAGWGELLRRYPESRLRVVGFDDGLAQLRLQHWMRQAGIDAARVTVEARLGMRYLNERVQSVDLALDAWPFGGSVTTAMTLTLGVPLVTATGNRAVSRAGASMLHELGLERYVAPTPERWVDCAADVLADADALAADRVQASRRFASTIGNGERLAGEVGELLIRAIERYRKGKPAEHDSLG